MTNTRRLSVRLLMLGSAVAVALGMLLAIAAPIVPGAWATVSDGDSLTAPAGTSEVWVDVESASAQDAVTQISVADGSGDWLDLPALPTMFGVGVIAPAVEGSVLIKVQSDRELEADVIVTFADDASNILGSARIAHVALADTGSGEDAGMTWAQMVPSADGMGATTPNGTRISVHDVDIATGDTPLILRVGDFIAGYWALLLAISLAVAGVTWVIVRPRAAATGAEQ